MNYIINTNVVYVSFILAIARVHVQIDPTCFIFTVKSFYLFMYAWMCFALTNSSRETIHLVELMLFYIIG